jgi:hypothetical protein
MANRYNVEIDHDERDFWHVNAFLIHDDPGDDGDIPDAVATTKKGATRDDAIALARRKFRPERITLWDACSECGGTGTAGDYDHELTECDECEDGKVPSNI